jgi:oxaloacetate decarboxylase beta subunit
MLEALFDFLKSTGFYALFDGGFDFGSVTMILVACFLLWLAIKKGFEPLLLVPIAFGMLLTNMPLGGIFSKPTLELLHSSDTTTTVMSYLDLQKDAIVGVGAEHTRVGLKTVGGLFYYLYQGVKLGIFPPLIFMGVGAMTDFGPLIANPKALLLGAAAQFGIFMTFIGAILLGFTGAEAGAIGIIGGADGPTAIFLASKLAPHLLGAIAVAAYSYMALVPVIQPPIMKALTTKEERNIKMNQLRVVSKAEKIIFPIAVTIIVSLIVPPATTLVGMLMLGNLFKECGVTARLEDTAKNALINIVTIFLGVTVGATATAEAFLQLTTIKIIVLGVIAFAVGTAAGVLLAKVMNKLTGGNINPLIGSAGVSAVPMAARVSQVVGQKENPSNFLLMHAMGPNVAGVIGSAVSAGVLLTLFQ